MFKLISTAQRSHQTEIMDEFDFKGQELEDVLREIDRVNRFLGGNKVSLKGIEHLIEATPQESFTLVDVGCGSGDLLRSIAKWAKEHKLQFKLIGIDANPHTIQLAQSFSSDYPEIEFTSMDVFSKDFNSVNADIITCCLTLHHFKDHQNKDFLQYLTHQSKLGVVINDLHRSSIAYYLFQLYALLFMKSSVAKTDGLISILRGFKKKDLSNYAQYINNTNHFITWQWAFRWLWVLQKQTL